MHATYMKESTVVKVKSREIRGMQLPQSRQDMRENFQTKNIHNPICMSSGWLRDQLLDDTQGIGDGLRGDRRNHVHPWRIARPAKSLYNTLKVD